MQLNNCQFYDAGLGFIHSHCKKRVIDGNSSEKNAANCLYWIAPVVTSAPSG